MYYIDKLKKNSIRVKLATGIGEEGAKGSTSTADTSSTTTSTTKPKGDSKSKPRPRKKGMDAEGRTNRYLAGKNPGNDGSSAPKNPSRSSGGGDITLYDPRSTTTSQTTVNNQSDNDELRRQLFQILYGHHGFNAGFNPFNGGQFNPFAYGNINIGGIGNGFPFYGGGFPFYGGGGYGNPFLGMPGVVSYDSVRPKSEPTTTTTTSTESAFDPSQLTTRLTRVRLSNGEYGEVMGLYLGDKLVKILDDYPFTPTSSEPAPTPDKPETPVDDPYSDENLAARKTALDKALAEEAKKKAKPFATEAADDVAGQIENIEALHGQINDRDINKARWMTGAATTGALLAGGLAWWLRNRRKRVAPFGDDYTEASTATLGTTDWNGEGPMSGAGTGSRKLALTPKRNMWDYIIPAGAATIGGIGSALVTDRLYDHFNPMPRPQALTPHYPNPTSTP